MDAHYHFSAQAISRKAGRSSVKAAAYRAGEKLVDVRTGEVSDYSRKHTLGGRVFLPGGGTMGRAELWNAVENKHKRGDAIVAREFEISLPRQLNDEQRQALAFEYAASVVDRYGVAADANLHPPDKVTERDLQVDPHRFWMDDGKGGKHNGNWHMHLQLSACYVDADGNMGKKCVELDPIHMQRINSQRKKDGLEPLLNAVEAERALWADMCNRHLEQAGLDVRVDHRSFADRGITDREPTTHHGVHARAIERKTGEKSDRRLADEAAMRERAEQAAADKVQEAQIAAEIATAQHQVEVLKLDLAELELDQEIAAKPRLPAAPTQPSSDDVRRALEQAQKRLFDPKARVDHALKVKAAKDNLDDVGAKRTAAGAKLWDLKGEIETALPMQRWEAEQTINEWRKKHPLLSWFHDRGVQSAHLSSFERALEQISRNEQAARRKFDKTRASQIDLNEQHAKLVAALEDARTNELERLQKHLEPLRAEVDRLESELEKALDREGVLQAQPATGWIDDAQHHSEDSKQKWKRPTG